jgi:L-iditol 2-dehydrogenase
VKAARVHAPGDLRIDEIPEPVAGPGEVVLRIGAAASCHTDVKSVLRGHPSLGPYPARLGHEFAGTIESAGPGVTTVAPGDVVFCSDSAPCGGCHQCVRGRESLCEDLQYLLGGFAEKLLVPERVVRTNLHPLPDGVPLRLAPIAEPLACAVHALDVVTVRKDEPVAILGGGSVGLMLCGLIASAQGLPIVLDPHPVRLEQARAFGASETILATRGAEDVERVRALTGGRGAELVIEAVGRPEAWELAVAMAAPGGTVNLFGGCAHDTSFTVPTARVHYDEVTLLGTYHHAPRYLAQALEILAADEHPWASLLTAEITLDELPERLLDPLAGKLSVRTAP